MNEFDVVVVGSLNLDLVGVVERFPGPGETVAGDTFAEFAGGKGLNQAVSAARSGARVAMVGAIGADHAGEVLRDVVRREGIDDSRLVSIDAAATGRAMVTVDRAGENSIVVFAGTNGLVDVVDVPVAKIFLAQLETNLTAVLDAFRVARDRGARTILNPAPAATLSREILGLVDVLVPNEHELELLGGVDELMRSSLGGVVVTRGGAGTELVEPNGIRRHLGPFPVQPIDSTGAGDAFCGALATRLAYGDDLVAAARFAAAAGALATTRRGAVPAQPTLSEIEQVLVAHPDVSFNLDTR